METSGPVAGVALHADGALLAELQYRHCQDLSRTLMPTVERLLGTADWTVSDLQGVAVSIGPGSFTGLRLGVTAAKTLAWTLGLPLIGVGVLEALAAERPAPERALVCSVVTASATQLYVALFQWVGARLEPRAGETLFEASDLARHLSQAPFDVVLTGDPGSHRSILTDALGERLTIPDPAVSPRAATIADLGHARLLAGLTDDPRSLVPRYLMRSTAESRRLGAARAS